MKKLKTIFQADIPEVGPMVLSEVSDSYAEKTCVLSEKFEYEPETISVLRSIEFDAFIDIGAAFGYFSLIAHSMGKEIVAIEPHPIRFGYLWWNFNGKDNATVLPYLVNDGSTYSISYASADIGGLIGKPVGTRVKNTYKCPTVTLSELCWGISAPHKKVLVKIDVEGFELDVLNGGIDTKIGDIPLFEHPNFNWIIEVHCPMVKEEQVLSYFPNKKNVSKILDRGEGKTTTFLIR